MSSNIIQEINLADAVPHPGPHNIARLGARRLVKLAPVLGGCPIIWRSPAPLEDRNEEGQKHLVYQCVVLVQKEPKPETMLVNIPLDLYQRLMDVPVEW